MLTYNPIAKAGWLIGGAAFLAFLDSALRQLPWSPALASSVNALTYFLGIYFLTRIFRARGEITTPRPTWQMTGRPTAAFWLAIGFLSPSILIPLALALSLLGQGQWSGEISRIPMAIAQVVLGVLYYVTWWKLHKCNPRVDAQ